MAKTNGKTGAAKGIPAKIEIGVYFFIDEETGKPVFDTDEMQREFESKVSSLEKEHE